MIRTLVKIATLLVASTFFTTAWSQQVHLQVLTEPDAPPGNAYKWLDALKKLGLDGVRLSTARPVDQPGVRTVGEGERARHEVTALLARDNVLHVPGGGRYRLSDVGRLRQFFADLKQHGSTDGPPPRQAFGLTAEQLVALHQALAPAVNFETAALTAKDTIRGIATCIQVPITIDPNAMRAFAKNPPTFDELRGVSCGTALAAVVRPLGLVVVPRATDGGGVELLVTDFRNAQEAWPVGWPLEKPDREAMPKLFEFLPARIENAPLKDAATAIAQRVEAPILFDHNAMARHGIDLKKTLVSTPEGRTYYKKLLDRALFDAGLKFEVRKDEAEKPLLWVYTIKK